MYGGEIASAFVRIRPNMTGFKSETESGVRSAFSGLAKIVGTALGAGVAFDFARNAVDSAANLQKQVEVINGEFGAAGGSVVKFANTTATALGATNNSVDQFSSRLGILYHNLGINEGAAASMTKRWAELGLAFNAAQGGGTQGAVDVLQRLQTAATGASTRGLSSLGISMNSTTQKVAAFKLGLTQSITQALTPAQKALATYSLAMAHLPSLLGLARSHSGDLANVQARLGAEWNKAKETLGKALLPEVTRVVKALSQWLDRMEKSGKLQKDFNQVARVASGLLHGVVTAVTLGVHAWDQLSGALGGAKEVAVAFLAVLAIQKIRSIASAIVSDLVNNGFKVLKIATVEEKAAYLDAFGTMEVATVGLSATIKSALITTGIGALVVAVGLAVGYVVTHWSTVKRYTIAVASAVGAAFHGMGEVVVGIGKTIAGALIAYLTFPLVQFIRLAADVAGWIPYIGDKIKAAADAVQSFSSTWGTGLAAQGGKEVVKGFHDVGSGAAQAFTNSLAQSSADPTQQSKAKDSGSKIGKQFADGVSSAVGQGVQSAGKTISDTLQKTINAANQKIQDTIRAAKNNLDKIGQDLAKTITEIQAKLGGADGAIAGSPQGQAFAKLKKLIESGAPSFEIARARQALASQLENVGKTQRAVVATELANLTAAFDKHKIGYKTFESRLHKILHDNGITLKEALKAGGPAFADAFKAEVRALGQQAKAIAAIPAKYRGIGGAGGAADIKIIRPLEVIRSENAKIAAVAQKQRDAQLKAAQKADTTLRAIHQTQISALPRPGYRHPRGKNSRHARKAATIGARP